MKQANKIHDYVFITTFYERFIELGRSLRDRVDFKLFSSFNNL